MFIEVPFLKNPGKLPGYAPDMVHATNTDNHWKIIVEEFDFDKASSFQPAAALKINFAASFFQRLSPNFQDTFNTK